MHVWSSKKLLVITVIITQSCYTLPREYCSWLVPMPRAVHRGRKQRCSITVSIKRGNQVRKLKFLIGADANRFSISKPGFRREGMGAVVF
ncbi:hypothetical protein RSAG8_10199, partial [Rhizoctonia solani AG-8 WAC10335]